MSEPTQQPRRKPIGDIYDWEQERTLVRLMYHGEEEILVEVVSIGLYGGLFKLPDNPDQLLFVPLVRIKQIVGPAFYTPEPPPAPKPKQQTLSKNPKGQASKKAPQAELLAAEGGAA